MALFDLRGLLVLVLASAAFTALCPAVYRRDPARRKLFLAILSVALAAAPWWMAAGLWTWPLGLGAAAVGVLSQPVPWLAVAVWWVVGAVLTTRTLLRVRHGRRELRTLPPLRSGAIAHECRGLAGNLGLAAPSLRAGPAPGASSLGKPILVLPPGAPSWPATTRRAVLCHELAHLKRRDDRLLLLVRLLADWYWWMPWLRSVYGRYVQAMEESCDDVASRLLTSRADYVDGLLQAARSLCGQGHRLDDPDTAWPVWVALLGHSHLAARVQRLLAAPRPMLRHTDGRWALLWASLAFAIGLTAQPSTVAPAPPDTTRLFPVTPAAPAAVADPAATLTRPRVETRSYVLDPRTATWRRVPSVRTPLPVYPARALASGLEGEVRVDLLFLPGRSSMAQLGSPVISSSDPSGVLAAAVSRALARSQGQGLGASLRTASAYNNDVAPPPPGTRLRLKTVYRFVLDRTSRSGTNLGPRGAAPPSQGG